MINKQLIDTMKLPITEEDLIKICHNLDDAEVKL